MILNELPKIVDKRAKRLGRGLGSGKGAKSGRGTTRHQKTKTDIPLHFEGGQARLVKKYPLLRGKGKNKSIRAKPFIIDFEILNKFKEGDVVDLPKLVEKGFLKNKSKSIRVKILANGKLEKRLTIKLPVSKAARKAIEKAGGKIEQ